MYKACGTKNMEEDAIKGNDEKGQSGEPYLEGDHQNHVRQHEVDHNKQT